MGYRSRLVRNSVYVGGAQVIHLVCNLLITPFIIHSVGLTNFGIWALFSSISSLLISLDMGMGASYLKFISEHYARKDFDHFNSIVNAGLIFNVTLITPILLLALFFKDTIYRAFNLSVGIYDSLDLLFSGILLLVFIIASTASYAAVLKATQRLKLASQIGALAILMKTVSVFVLLTVGLDLKGLLFSEFIFVFVLNISSILYAKRLVPQMKINILLFRWKDLRSMLGYGIRLQMSQIAVLVHQQTDKPLLAYLSGLESVSFYRIAQQMGNLLRLATSFVSPVVVPAASELSSLSDQEGLKKLSKQGLGYVSFITVSLATFVWLHAEQIITFWIGSIQLHESVSVLKILVIAYAIARLNGFLSTVARGVGIVGIEMKSSLILVLVKLPLSYFFIASFGVQGAAVAVLIAVTISQYYFLSRFLKMVGTIELSQMTSFASKLMFATATCSLLFWYGHQHIPSSLFTDRIAGGAILILEMLLYYVAFGLCLFLLKGFVVSDVRVIFESLRRES